MTDILASILLDLQRFPSGHIHSVCMLESDFELAQVSDTGALYLIGNYHHDF